MGRPVLEDFADIAKALAASLSALREIQSRRKPGETPAERVEGHELLLGRIIGLLDDLTTALVEFGKNAANAVDREVKRNETTGDVLTAIGALADGVESLAARVARLEGQGGQGESA